MTKKENVCRRHLERLIIQIADKYSWQPFKMTWRGYGNWNGDLLLSFRSSNKDAGGVSWLSFFFHRLLFFAVTMVTIRKLKHRQVYFSSPTLSFCLFSNFYKIYKKKVVQNYILSCQEQIGFRIVYLPIVWNFH
jgi:hypothetical protein